MDRWAGRVAVVTGGNSGIGKAILTDLVKAGLIVIGLDVRCDNIELLKEMLKDEKGELHAMICDVSSEITVNEILSKIEKKFGGVNILVNNAGILANSPILGPTSYIENLAKSIDINLKGVLYCTRVVDDILMRTGEAGHIVNMGSIASHIVPFVAPPVSLNVYAGTKHAMKAVTEVLRQELITRNKKVQVSMISPGWVRTGILSATGMGDTKEIFEIALNPEDVSQACIFILGTSTHVQVHDIIIRAVGEPF